LNELKGKIALIEFWRADCSHCQEAAPFMESLYKKYSPQGLKVVTFHSPSTGSGPETHEGNWSQVQKTMKEWGITYPVAFDEGAEVFKKYNGARYPTVIILNREGEIEYLETGHTPEKEKSLIAAIEAMLKGTAMVQPTAQANPQSSPAAP
jgi:thiol-disulfide isomerase/thioredoxin